MEHDVMFRISELKAKMFDKILDAVECDCEKDALELQTLAYSDVIKMIEEWTVE